MGDRSLGPARALRPVRVVQRLADRWFQSFSIPGYQAYETNQKTLKTFGSGEFLPLVAVFHSDGDVTKQTAIADRGRRTAATPGRARASSSYFSTGSDAYVSKDRHTTFAEIYPPGNPTFTSTEQIKQVRRLDPRGGARRA